MLFVQTTVLFVQMTNLLTVQTTGVLSVQTADQLSVETAGCRYREQVCSVQTTGLLSGQGADMLSVQTAGLLSLCRHQICRSCRQQICCLYRQQISNIMVGGYLFWNSDIMGVESSLWRPQSRISWGVPFGIPLILVVEAPETRHAPMIFRIYIFEIEA